MRKFSLLIIALLAAFQLQAQELKCSVSIQAPNLVSADPIIFKTLENDLYEFIANRKWTEKAYEQEERIECTFNINITEEVAPNQFRARVSIQSNRPVFNSSYNTVTFNYTDNIEFQYVEFQQLEFNENAYLHELSSLMAFYAYMILGFDYDSFALHAGTPYFDKAAAIVNNAQTAGISDGWQAFDGNNTRYWYNEQALNAKFQRCREAYYIYHRKGLDQMYDNPVAARFEIQKAMQLMADLQEEFPNIMLQSQFMGAKSEELVGIFGDPEIDPTLQAKMRSMLTRLDPSNAQDYNRMNSLGATPTRPGLNSKGRGIRGLDRPTTTPKSKGGG